MHHNLSAYLDLVRLLAALVVFASHATYQRFTGGLPALGPATGLGHEAVMVFFVLSGFVMAHVVTTHDRTLPAYAASRLARLWSVVLPALVLTMALDAAGSVLTPALYSGRWYEFDHAPWRVLAAASFTHELWFSYTRPFSNGPFWSLGYEAWYYVLFGAAHFLQGRMRLLTLAAVCALIGPKILLLLPVWAMGVWAWRWVGEFKPGRVHATVLCFGALAAAVLVHLAGGPGQLAALTAWLLGDEAMAALSWSSGFLADWVLGACVAIHLAGAAALARHLPPLPGPLLRAVRRAAGLTFALYLLHYPLLQFFAALTPVAGLEDHRAWFVTLAPLVVVAWLGPGIERDKVPLRAALAGWLAGGPRRTAQAQARPA